MEKNGANEPPERLLRRRKLVVDEVRLQLPKNVSFIIFKFEISAFDEPLKIKDQRDISPAQ